MPPIARVEPVQDSYFGTAVADPYRWMETPSAGYAQWLAGQGAWAAEQFAALPDRDPLRRRIRELRGTGTQRAGFSWAGEWEFCLRTDPGAPVAALTVQSGDGVERVLLDPATIPGPGHHHLGFYRPSRTGRYVACAISAGGSENATVRVIEVATGAIVEETVGNVRFPFLSWVDDESFRYHAYLDPTPGAAPTAHRLNSRTSLHRLGADPAADQVLLARGLNPRVPLQPRDRPFLYHQPGTDQVLALVSHAALAGHRTTFGLSSNTIYLAPVAGLADPASCPWAWVAGPDDRVSGFAFGPDTLYLINGRGAPRGQVLSVPLADPAIERARVVVPESDRVIEAVMVVGADLLIRDLDVGVSRLRRLRLAATRPAGAEPGAAEPAGDEPAADEPAAGGLAGAEPGGSEPAGGGLAGAAPGGAEPGGAEPGGGEPSQGEPGGGEPEDVPLPLDGGIQEWSVPPGEVAVLLRIEGWTTPPRGYRYDLTAGEITAEPAETPVPAGLPELRTYRVLAPARDGTPIPVTLLHRADLALDGSHPTVLDVYGSYGLSNTPRYRPGRLAWLERGGVYAVGHIRGGGELGDAWRQAGARLAKENTITDLIDCAEYLIAAGYTSAGRIAGSGASAGGIPTGGALVRRPELWGAMVLRVPLVNALRAEVGANGPINVPEFGSVSTPDGLAALLVADAYQRVTDGVRYPAVLLTTGLNDPRVATWQPGKMTARLQAASSSGRPVLLRVEEHGGHGMADSTEQEDQLYADMFALLLRELGHPTA
ncbi:MAG TPA: prolyl oligopeptidase family serine peptidase [Mycobacteriales bacterium]|nr:prolyl oligopeptidase family serine peptidase [Mycobacteriales bacterium]